MADVMDPPSSDDAIFIEGIEIPAALGVTAAERALLKPVRIDLEIGYPLAASGESDRKRRRSRGKAQRRRRPTPPCTRLQCASDSSVAATTFSVKAL